jgi:alkylation response protein AidB-like acyl-CoA dehydrogenase
MTDDDGRFREQVRSALADIVLPHADSWETTGKIDSQGWRSLGDRGLLGLAHTGPEFMRSAVFLDELGRTGYTGVRAAIGVHAYMARSYLELFGNDEQRAAYLPATRQGQRIAALAMTEDNAGSDLRNLSTRAELGSDGNYRVTGRKCYVTNGSAADFFVTLVRTGPASASKVLSHASVLLIDADLPGITRQEQPLLGWRSADVCTVEFADVPVPASRLLGRPGQALTQLMKALDFERLVAGVLAVGGIGYCLELLRAFVRDHRLGDSPMSAKQAIRQRVADLDCDFELVRQYALHAARQQCRGRLDTRTASILKLKSTELAVVAAQQCLTCHGARGYQQDSAVSRMYRDAIGGTIAGGVSELMRDMIYELGLAMASAITSASATSGCATPAASRAQKSAATCWAVRGRKRSLAYTSRPW